MSDQQRGASPDGGVDSAWIVSHKPVYPYKFLEGTPLQYPDDAWYYYSDMVPLAMLFWWLVFDGGRDE